jgi:hypothetical protein
MTHSTRNLSAAVIVAALGLATLGAVTSPSALAEDLPSYLQPGGSGLASEYLECKTSARWRYDRKKAQICNRLSRESGAWDSCVDNARQDYEYDLGECRSEYSDADPAPQN